MIIKNNRQYPIPFYYISGKNRKSVRIGAGQSVNISDLSSFSPLSKRDMDNGCFTTITGEVKNEEIMVEKIKNEEKLLISKSKMKKASEDVENYINKEN